MTQMTRKSAIAGALRARVALTTLFVGSVLVNARSLHAQDKARGPLVLRLPSSAHVLAMGNAGIASSDGDVVLHNPGMLGAARGMALSLQRYSQWSSSGSFGSVMQSGSFTFGLGAQYVSWSAPGLAYGGAINPGASRLQEQGGIPASSSEFVVGVARTVKGLRLGAAVKYVDERIGSVQDGIAAVDIGAYSNIGPATLAVTIQNLGMNPTLGADKGELPRRIGVGYGTGLQPVWEHWDLGAQFQVAVENEKYVRPAAGVEIGYVPIEGVALVGRAGVRGTHDVDESPVTGGIGLVLDRWAVDYAVEPFKGGKIAHRIGLRVR